MVDAQQFPVQALAQGIGLIVICLGWIAYMVWNR